MEFIFSGRLWRAVFFMYVVGAAMWLVDEFAPLGNLDHTLQVLIVIAALVMIPKELLSAAKRKMLARRTF